MAEEPTEEKFASRLAQAMGERGLKQVDLLRLAAERGVKLGKSQLSQYVGGKTVPRPQAMSALADLLGVDADWLGAATPPGARASRGQAASASAPVTRPAATPVQHKEHPMRQFTKSHKLDNVLYDVRGPVLDEAKIGRAHV